MRYTAGQKHLLMNEALAFVSSLKDEQIELYRRPVHKLGGAKTKQSTRKYACPRCRIIIRATKEVQVAAWIVDFGW